MKSLEFAISNTDKMIHKFLWDFWHGHSWSVLDYLQNYWVDSPMIHRIFAEFAPLIRHFAMDTLTDRYKFYISLYHLSLYPALHIINRVKNILWESSQYYLEKNFIQFDCIGLDIYKDNTYTIKIYEILDIEHFPNIIPSISIKEAWCLKQVGSSRIKWFYRLCPYLNIDHFSHEFDQRAISTMASMYNVQTQWKVKYYCHEGDQKQEIYFI